MTAQQLAEWEAYNQIDPIGKWRDSDFGWAYLASEIENIFRLLTKEKGKTVELTTVLDYLPDWQGKKKKPKQSVEDMKAAFLSAFKHKGMRGKRPGEVTKPTKIVKR